MLPADLPPPPPPHTVIIIQADDLGIDDLGTSGNPFAYTPHIDALARESVLALDFTVNPVCAPSRATLLTGRHFLRTGVSHVHGGKDFLHLDERTMGDAFSASGWHTGLWGKWHSGTADGYLPWQRGFSEAFCAQLYRHENPRGELNGAPVEHPDTWADAVIVDYAIDFLERHPSTAAEPALLYLSSLSPHGPLRAPEPWIEFHRARGLDGNLAVLNAMVSSFDEQVGRLVRHLRDSGRLENTLLLLTSDNGPAINRGLLTDEELRLRKVGGRRGWKGDIWENGVRAPLFVHWPNALVPGVVRAPLDQVDLLPTLLDWCRVPWPEDWPTQDGLSRRVLLQDAGRQMGMASEQLIFNYAHAGWITSKRPYDPFGLPGEYNPVHVEAKGFLDALEQPISVRRGRYKLLLNPFPPEFNSPPARVLIDLYEDPAEAVNLAETEPAITAALEAELVRWFEGIQAAPHSFTAGVYHLVDAALAIPAKNLARIEGPLQNYVQGVRGWNAPASAAWELEAATPATRTVTLTWQEAPPPGLRLRLRAGEAAVNATTNASGTTVFPPLAFPAGRFLLSLGLDAAPEGTPEADLCEVRVAAVRVPGAN